MARPKKMKGSLLARAVPESEYSLEKKKEKSRELDAHVARVSAPFNVQQTIVRRDGKAPAEHRKFAKVDVKQKEGMSSASGAVKVEDKPKLKKAKTLSALPKPSDDMVVSEMAPPEKVRSEKSTAHAENLRKVQKLRKEKGISLKDAWLLLKK